MSHHWLSFDFRMTRAPCRNSISATGHSEIELSNAARATMKIAGTCQHFLPASFDADHLEGQFSSLDHHITTMMRT
jgi:hypothetical protein